MVKILAAALLLAVAWVAAWWVWTDNLTDPPSPAAEAPPPSPPPTAARGVPQPSPPPLAPPEPSRPPPSLDTRPAEAIERVCPWPPDPLSWQVLDAPCLEAMDALMMNDRWRRVLDDDHVGTRRAVVEALDRAECRAALAVDADGTPTPVERRTDLHQTCAAEAMARLADLQAMCFQTAHMDLDVRLQMRQSYNDLAYDENPDLAEHHRRETDEDHLAARTYWKVYRCRSVPPEALEWVETLPTPRETDILDAAQAAFFNAPDVYGRRRGEITQAKHLLEAARHLGWE